jgi:hypothetical protein
MCCQQMYHVRVVHKKSRGTDYVAENDREKGRENCRQEMDKNKNIRHEPNWFLKNTLLIISKHI